MTQDDLDSMHGHIHALSSVINSLISGLLISQPPEIAQYLADDLSKQLQRDRAFDAENCTPTLEASTRDAIVHAYIALLRGAP